MTDSKPVIGISMFNGCIEGRPHYAIANNYISAVRRVGAVPWLIAPSEPNVELIMHKLDGLLLTGGSDISPSLYSDAQHAEVVDVDVTRDGTELELFRAAFACSKPILGVCRGMQLLNVALGGTLNQHLFDSHGCTVEHRANEKLQNTHCVQLQAGTLLSDIYNSKSLEVVSWHHQAVDRLGEGVVVSALAADGLVEAVEVPTYNGFCIGVQWHPEVVLTEPWKNEELFAHFVASCK